MAVPLLIATACGMANAAVRAPVPHPIAGPATIAALTAQIDAHIDAPRFTGADWGIAVVSLDTGRTLYAHQPGHLQQPASTAKLYTAALALSELGTDYRIPTQLLAGGEPQHGRLNGPLILYGMGDPTLGIDPSTQDWADQLATQLVARGIHHVHGDLIADDTYFASPSMGTGWEAIDLQSWFAVPSSALSVQENQFELTVTPGATAGASARLAGTPAAAIALLPVNNRLTTGAARTRNDINLYRAPGSSTLHAFGSIAVHAPAQTFKLAVAEPARQAGTELLQALARHGVQLDGALKTVHWPDQDAARDGTGVVAQVLSPPVSEILRSGLKRSQNLYLQNLLLIAGAQAQARAMQAPAPPTGFVTTETWGINTLRQLLDRIGIPPSASLIEDGAGLSRRDLTTPDAMARLLAFLAAQPYADTLREALPIAGVDGTLIGRMRNTPAAANVHAKTGSMAYVHCLAGYATSAAGERLAFAIMLDNYDAPADAPSASQDVDAVAVLLAGLRERSH